MNLITDVLILSIQYHPTRMILMEQQPNSPNIESSFISLTALMSLVLVDLTS